MAKCESPIEEKLLLHVLSECDMDAEVRSQVEAGRFRVDIAVSDHDSGWKLAVECDGHDFHERTKEQAQRDKSRDRALALDGWTVMRFTGSEIWRNARGCASQVLQMVRKHEANNE
jgi:very-short-patch-repair endonuclease